MPLTQAWGPRPDQHRASSTMYRMKGIRQQAWQFAKHHVRLCSNKVEAKGSIIQDSKAKLAQS